jgi:hypothetical protein
VYVRGAQHVFVFGERVKRPVLVKITHGRAA